MSSVAHNDNALKSTIDDPSLVCLGAIFGAVGVRGAVRLKVFTEDIKSICDYGPLTLYGHECPDGKQVKAKILHNIKGGIAVKLDGIEDRNVAESLKGSKLYIARDVLPKIEEEDGFYFEDLVGLTAKNLDGETFGTIDGVFNFGAGDIIEVKLSKENGKRMYPFSDEVVPEVNIDAGIVVIKREAFDDDIGDAEEAETN